MGWIGHCTHSRQLLLSHQARLAPALEARHPAGLNRCAALRCAVLHCAVLCCAVLQLVCGGVQVAVSDHKSFCLNSFPRLPEAKLNLIVCKKCSALPCPALPCPALPCPALQGCVDVLLMPFLARKLQLLLCRQWERIRLLACSLSVSVFTQAQPHSTLEHKPRVSSLTSGASLWCEFVCCLMADMLYAKSSSISPMCQ